MKARFIIGGRIEAPIAGVAKRGDEALAQAIRTGSPVNRNGALGLVLIAAAAGAAAPASHQGARETAAAAVQVAAGVYMVRGARGEINTSNLGRIGNAGFIVGAGGVVAIDTGTSYRHGAALLAAIRRVTAKPVRLVMITHARQEFLFGAAAYREQGIPVHMQRMAAGLMRTRCEQCLTTLNAVLGAGAMQGTTMVKPDQEFDHPHVIDVIGRRIRVLYYGHASGPGDVAVFDEPSGVLFAGGLLDYLRIPDVQDSDLEGWKRALQALRALPVKAVVPGHGPVASVPAIAALEAYLTRLEIRVLALLRSGAALSEVPGRAALPEFARWDQYQTIHRRNAAVLFVRFEREHLFK